jgi:hypothetical protein
MHPIHRRLLAEELTRRRRADEDQRYAASQRRGRIDPNPHQIDAVVFALRRLPEGGCILADEVGLGKTIEAGLIMAQLLAEGTRRVLLIVPRPLVGQWQSELYGLFGISTREGRADPDAFTGDGVFLVSRELAGGERGASILRTSDPFDLVVIDEAHEVFSGLHKRYDKRGEYADDSTEARMAGRVRSVVGKTPVLLLTATPIQNSLVELWSLVQFVEPTGTLLGRLPTFRALFCDGDDRRLAPGLAHELRRRVDQVMQRTLRRQAAEFLDTPFVERRTKLIEYRMSDEERALYEGVTSWLLDPRLCAFHGGTRRLLLIAFHRRMGSSLRALSASLDKVAARLRDMLERRGEPAQLAAELVADLEGQDHAEDQDEDEEPAAPGDPGPPTPERIRAELAKVEEFARRARALPTDSKARALVDAVRLVVDRGARGEGSGKVVVFTEALSTQDYLAELLVASGLAPDDVTLFRGQNDGPRARAALARWDEEVGRAIPPASRPSPQVALRLALVHEFRTRSRVFIATEAGGKGLNLQFCETIVNVDLPWNPQRIEQRIGRCHRYGQTRGVLVLNFLARDNEAQRLTFELLSQKLELFGEVLDASDAVLHSPGGDSPELLASTVGADFQARLARIYERARSLEDVTAELRDLRERLTAERQAFDEARARTSQMIEGRLDDRVRRSFRRWADELPASLAGLDRDLERLVTGWLDALGARYERTTEPGRVRLTLAPHAALPAGYEGGVAVAVGHARDLSDAEPLHPGHTLVRAAVDEARAATARPLRVRLRDPALAGRRGRLVVTKVAHRGFEPTDALLPLVLLEGDPRPLERPVVDRLLALTVAEDREDEALAPLTVDPAQAVEALVDAEIARAAERDEPRFQRALEQVERYVEDQVLVVRRELTDVEERLSKAGRKREGAVGPDARARLDRELASLEARRQELLRKVERVEARDDPSYLLWRDRAHARRYARPEVTRVLDVSLSFT